MVKYIEYFLTSNDPLYFGLKLFVAFIVSLVLSYLAIPLILKISKSKNLMAVPGDRSSHDTKVPNLGGIAIFYSIGICAPIFAYELFVTYKFLFPILVILLYIGVMDDILEIRAYKKLIAQVVIAVLMVIGSDVRIKSLFGIMGIYELDYIVSVIISITTFIVMINAFNLIDGIDGLAGIFSVICCLIFGLSYHRLGEPNYPMVVLCVIIIGALLSFLYYNLSDKKEKKIFMGDTGSMMIGFLLVFTAFYFIEIFSYETEYGDSKYHLMAAPVIALAILILPIIDTLSVIIIRLLSGKSPMEADKNHIHHKLLAMGFSHKKSTMYIVLYYVGVIGITYALRHIDVNLLLLTVLGLGFLGSILPNLIMKYRNKG